MIEAKLKREFQEDVVGEDYLAKAITWIQRNLNPEDVFEYQDLRDWAEEHLLPARDAVESVRTV